VLNGLNEDAAIGCMPRQNVSFRALVLPPVRMEADRSATQGVGLLDLAVDLNRQIKAARKEYAQPCEPPPRPLR
jgi:hypothetical protein